MCVMCYGVRTYGQQQTEAREADRVKLERVRKAREAKAKYPN